MLHHKNQKPDQEFAVTDTCRLLPFLLRNLKKCSRNNVKSLLVHKQVFVDGSCVTHHDYSLHPGQKVLIKHSMIRDSGSKNSLDIIFEDQDIIVINKQAGLLSISSEKEKKHTAYHMLMDHVRESDPGNHIFIVHRLDRDTSGLMLFAKNQKMKLALQENWTELLLSRGYMAVVEGRPSSSEGSVISWLKETKTHLMYSSHTKGDGQQAITNYKVIKSSGKVSILDIRIETGRKNQIRVHMKDIGHPVAGDKKYGAATNPFRGKGCLSGRLGLHASVLIIKHPTTGKEMKFESCVPKNFNKVFLKLTDTKQSHL